MIKQLFVIETADTDPYHNLGLEKYLFDRVPANACILYIWQNDRTVVIGRNQLAENECNIALIEKDGGHIARRLSGGGAVYHDMGNLNFTFIMNTEDFDEPRQTEVILKALNDCGAVCEKNGRNDILLKGRKLSGHAYYHHNGHSYHHGTIMFDVDLEKLSSYLNVSPLKLRDRHVKSVRSRVINLKDAVEGLSIDEIRVSLTNSFAAVYGLKPTVLHEKELNKEDLDKEISLFKQSSWIFSEKRHFEVHKEQRFKWGIVSIDYNLVGDIISDCQISSDGMNSDFLSELGVMFKGHSIKNLEFLINDTEYSEMLEDVITLLRED